MSIIPYSDNCIIMFDIKRNNSWWTTFSRARILQKNVNRSEESIKNADDKVCWKRCWKRFFQWKDSRRSPQLSFSISLLPVKRIFPPFFFFIYYELYFQKTNTIIKYTVSCDKGIGKGNRTRVWLFLCKFWLLPS